MAYLMICLVAVHKTKIPVDETSEWRLNAAVVLPSVGIASVMAVEWRGQGVSKLVPLAIMRVLKV
jgi:hypothetical protein